MSTPAQLRAKALAQIMANGAEFALRRPGSTYDANNAVTTGSAQTWNGWAADWQFRRDGAGGGGELLDAKDARLIVAAEGLTDPRAGDRATYAGIEYTVVDAVATRKAGIAIVYDVHLTRD